MVRQNGLVVNKYFREFIVAVSKLTKQYAVMLINIITNLPTVMANSNNPTKQLSTLEIVSIVVGIIVGIGGLIVAIYMCRSQPNPGSSPEHGRMIGGDNVGGDNYSGANFSGDANIGNTNNNTRE